MTKKRFTLAYEKGNWWAVKDGDITLWKEETIALLNSLNDENEQLKSENQHIKNTITEAYQNERTTLGKSVLKQLIEQLMR